MSGIYIALGANLDHPSLGPPRASCEAALESLQKHGPQVLGRSRWYRSAPVPHSGQPWFVNGVAEIATGLDPGRLLALLHRIENDFGRVRLARDEARVLDLDLIAYGGRVSAPGAWPVLPHPRLAERAFVVLPLAELAPAWRHPASGLSAAELAESLQDQGAVPFADE
jgi:2-amino-4-hydroxy-6-hydroxymethyldihydropteridine diphosphokinase